MNKELTESSWLMRLIVSAKIFATDNCLIFLQFLAFFSSVIVSVITISSSSESLINLMALPEK